LFALFFVSCAYFCIFCGGVFLLENFVSGVTPLFDCHFVCQCLVKVENEKNTSRMAYNGVISAEENVASKWGNVQNVYQRRADLIPNLVATVKAYAEHEKTTLEELTNARTKATQMTVNVDDLTPEKLREFQRTQGELSTALGRLIAITENYPDLKANQNFLELQAQLEGTENRINVERKNFNKAAKAYNTKIRRFPTSVLASSFGFEKKPYFEAEAGSEVVPEVRF
jgi:LemA protein